MDKMINFSILILSIYLLISTELLKKYLNLKMMNPDCMPIGDRVTFIPFD